jgi:hypothetical protein
LPQYPVGQPQYPGGQPQYQAGVPVIVQVAAPAQKWRALRTIAGIFKVFAWVVGSLGVLAALLTLAESGRYYYYSGAFFPAIAELIGAGIVFLTFYGYAELILLLIAIEENTRKTP